MLISVTKLGFVSFIGLGIVAICWCAFASFVVGIVDDIDIIDGSEMRPGQKIVILA